MDGENALQTISEVSITLAGLSGLAAAFRKTQLHAWPPRERLTFWLLISNRLAALFFSVLPIALFFAGAPYPAIWGSSTALLVAYIIAALVACVRRSQALDRLGDHTPNSTIWGVAIPANAVLALILLFSAFDLFIPRGLAMYYAGVLTLIAMACLAFVLFLLSPLSARDDA